MIDWHVLGVGAMGSLWACYLHKAGFGVKLLLKDEQRLSEYQNFGALTLSKNGQREKFAIGADTAHHADTEIRNLLVTTKAHQCTAAMAPVAGRLAPDCRILLIQNGMGVAEQVAEKFPHQPLFCGVTTDGAYCPQPFSVVYAGLGRTNIGSFQNRHDPLPLTDLLPKGFLGIEACNDIESRQWQKLAINCAVNGLTVIYRCRNGELLEIEEAQARLKKLCDEVAQLASVIGQGDRLNNLYDNTVSVIKLTANNYSSMYQDIDNRRKSEIDFINGYFIEQAHRHGVACGENEKLLRDVKQIERTLKCR